MKRLRSFYTCVIACTQITASSSDQLGLRTGHPRQSHWRARNRQRGHSRLTTLIACITSRDATQENGSVKAKNCKLANISSRAGAVARAMRRIHGSPSIATAMKIMDRYGSVNSAGAVVGVSQSNVLRPISVAWLEVLTHSISVIGWPRESLSKPHHSSPVSPLPDWARHREFCIAFSSTKYCPEDHRPDSARFFTTHGKLPSSTLMRLGRLLSQRKRLV